MSKIEIEILTEMDTEHYERLEDELKDFLAEKGIKANILSHATGNELTVNPMKDRKIRLTKEEAYRIARTPPNECWICAYLTERIGKDEQGYFLLESDLEDEGIKEHLKQILGRNL